jgi:hypothetical protein
VTGTQLALPDALPTSSYGWYVVAKIGRGVLTGNSALFTIAPPNLAGKIRRVGLPHHISGGERGAVLLDLSNSGG